MDWMNQDTHALREQLNADIHRPQYHFLPPTNWMNDPNGVIQWNGKYHLFYQHNPYGPLWGNMSWGHAVSTDMIHWTDLPLALTPDPDGYDAAGCFSGCSVDDNGTPTILYTATTGEHCEVQVQAIATSQDNLLTWEKHKANPIIKTVPAEARQTSDFRDPFVWREDNTWYMVLGSRMAREEGDVGAVFLYRSQNLTDWEYLNPLLIGEDERHGLIWECPNFFKLQDKWVLIISAHQGHTTGTVHWFVGDYHNHRFEPQLDGVLDFGDLYAPLTMLDSDNRRILFGWLREARSEVDQRLAGWSGVQCVPRVLSLDSQNRLISEPISEVEAIRGNHLSMSNTAVSKPMPLDIAGLQLDITAEFQVTDSGTAGFSLAFSGQDSERTDIVFDATRGRLRVEKHFPHVFGAMTAHSREVPHQLAPGENLELRILLDGSVLEIIANGRTSLSRRIYPTHAASDAVQLLGNNATVVSLNIWEMSSIWQ
jgi:beta-fructofuranosidase